MLQSLLLQVSPGVNLDLTITLGNLITIIGGVSAVVWATSKLSTRHDALEKDVIDMRQDLKSVGKSISEVAIVQHQLANSKERMDRMEAAHAEALQRIEHRLDRIDERGRRAG